MPNSEQMVKMVFFTVKNIMVGIRAHDGQIAAMRNQPDAENQLVAFLKKSPNSNLSEDLPFSIASCADEDQSNLFKSATASLMVAQICTSLQLLLCW
jgi:hypothetical protein